MTIGQYNDGLRRAVQFVDRNGVSKQAILGNRPQSQHFIQEMLKQDYEKIYNAGINNSDFNILMYDDSFFQFSYRKDEADMFQLRYAFYQSPKGSIDYDSFLLENNFDKNDVGDLLIEEYNQYLIENAVARVPNPIRYEYDHIRYEPLIHSLSHIHIGHNSDIRIPLNRVLTPMAFALFVLKHCYYKHFTQLISYRDFRQTYLSMKTLCSILDVQSFTDDERNELHIS